MTRLFLRALILLSAASVIPMYAQVPGRVALWKGENNGLDSVGGNTGVLPGGATFVPDRNGTGLAFRMNGASSRIPVLQAGTGLDLRRFTISAWVKTDATTPVSQTVIYKGGPGSLNYALYLAGTDWPGVAPNTPVLDVYVGDVNFGVHYFAISNQTCTPGLWCHIAGSYDGALLRVYVNGIERGSGTAPDAFGSSGQQVDIGTSRIGTIPFVGALDEIAVYNRALLDAEVMTVFNTTEPPPPPPPTTPGLVALWKGENNGLDSIGGNTGLLPAGATFVPDRDNTGFAFRMNGVASRIPVMQAGPALDLRRFTISAWVKTDATTTTGQTVLHKGAPGAINYTVFLAGTDWPGVAPNTAVIDFYVGDVNFGTHYYVVSSQTCTPGVWCHVAWSYDGSLLRVYVNGALSGTSAAPDAFSTSGQQIDIGTSRLGTSPFIGAIDELAVYNRALSDAEILPAPTVTATINLTNAQGVGLGGGLVSYLDQSNVWQTVGVTPASGSLQVSLPAGTWRFRMRYNGQTMEKLQNISTPVVFTTTAVRLQFSHTIEFLNQDGQWQSYSKPLMEMLPVGNIAFRFGDGGVASIGITGIEVRKSIAASKLVNSMNGAIAGATGQYYLAGWRPCAAGGTNAAGYVLCILDGFVASTTFSLEHAYTQQQKTQNIAIDSYVQFQTRLVRVQLRNSYNVPQDVGAVQYYAGGWRTFGNTSSGEVTNELMPGTYSFSMGYAFTQEQKTQDIAANSTVLFQTKLVTVELRNSSGTLIDPGTAQYYAGGWRSMPATVGGQTTVELMPGTYNFNMTYASTTEQKTQNIGVNPTVQFQTKAVIVSLKNSNGAMLPDGSAQYYAGGWRSIGNTSPAGQTSVELMGGTYTFSMTYAFTTEQKTQNISANPNVEFQTRGVVLRLLNSSGALIDPGSAQYYAGGWRNVGATSGGQVPVELMAGTYSFSMTYAFTQQQKTQNIAADNVVIFQTGRVQSATNTCTAYYAGGWRAFVNGMDLLPGTYTFQFNDGTPATNASVVATATASIH